MGSLSLIFNQSLLWIGLLFSPLLAAVVSIKMVLTFYIKVRRSVANDTIWLTHSIRKKKFAENRLNLLLQATSQILPFSTNVHTVFGDDISLPAGHRCRTWLHHHSVILIQILYFSMWLHSRISANPSTRVAVSEQCGPFRDHGFMFQVFVEGMLELRDVRPENPLKFHRFKILTLSLFSQGHWFWRLILIVTKPAVIGGILLLMW